MAIFAFIKRLIFYLGVLIIITSFFIPIISFDGNSFALIDNNPYIPTVVIILCVAELILLFASAILSSLVLVTCSSLHLITPF